MTCWVRALELLTNADDADPNVSDDSEFKF